MSKLSDVVKKHKKEIDEIFKNKSELPLGMFAKGTPLYNNVIVALENTDFTAVDSRKKSDIRFNFVSVSVNLSGGFSGQVIVEVDNENVNQITIFKPVTGVGFWETYLSDDITNTNKQSAEVDANLYDDLYKYTTYLMD